MHQNPALAHKLVRDRVGELRHSAAGSARNRGEKRRHRITEAARQGTGWLLIDMGLRLAGPRGAMNHPLAREQR